MSEIENKWTAAAAKLLVGKKIVGVRYLSKSEAKDLDWSSRPIVLMLDDGTSIFPSMDDEGNNGGALFTDCEELDTIPVMGMGKW